MRRTILKTAFCRCIPSVSPCPCLGERYWDIWSCEPPDRQSNDTMINALVVANRCIGYINAPSLFQLVVADCLGCKEQMWNFMTETASCYMSLCKDMGFECVKPEAHLYAG